MRVNTFYYPMIFALLFMLPNAAQSQRTQRFKAGIIAGLTASQIDGDESAGYHKVGLQAGLRGVARLKKKQDASVEILYTQRGCRHQPQTFPLFSTTLNYIEVPVQWHYHDWLVDGDEDDGFYRVQFNAGLSYGRLLDYKDKYGIEGGGITAALPDLNSNSFTVLLGATFYASRHIGFTFRWQRALNNLYNTGEGGNYAKDLNEHSIAFQALYMF